MIAPFCDLGRESRALHAELLAASDRVIRSGRFLYGVELESFENEIAEWHGVKYAVGVASGTDAVEIGLRCAWGAGPVWCPAFAPVPCVNAVEAAGCTPILFDADPVTRMSMGGSRMFVHMFGLAGDPIINAVEDCAHSMGATAMPELESISIAHSIPERMDVKVWRCRICQEDVVQRLTDYIPGKRPYHSHLAGTMGKCGALSFYPSKTMGALGDGGAIITNDPVIAEHARRIRHYGFDDNGNVTLRGQNSRLSEIQAGFLRVKLPHVHGWIERRREIAARYNAELAERVTVPTEPEGSRGVYHVYVIESEERDRLATALKAAGIGTMVHYPKAIHQYERWKHLGEPGQFPVAEKLAATVLSLPCYPYLEESEQDAVIAAVREAT